MSLMKNNLFLFDIDGTLISPGPTARRAINTAIENYTGIKPNLQIKDVAGLTDRLIVRNALKKAGKDSGAESVIDDIVNEYIRLFERTYPDSTEAFVYKDSINLVNKVKRFDIPMGLLTGNVKRGAEIKLGKFDLMRYFPFGAFADDGNTRNDLPEVARRIAMDTLKMNFDPIDIILVGDTPEDAIAAKTNGCKSIVVCRRKEWYNEIVNAGADLIVDNLDDPQIEIEFLS